MHSQFIFFDRPEYGPEANVLLVDMLKKMLIKDPEQRISLLEIMSHDWITCNGVQPMPIHFYPSINVKPQDANDAIKKVHLIANIRIKIRKRISAQKLRKPPISSGFGGDTSNLA